jgi:hypothetical protein
MKDNTTLHMFKATGGFHIDNKLKPAECYDGSYLVGFELPDGRTARLIIGLEIESADGGKCEYITASNDMEALGFEGLDYNELHFELPTE